MRPRMTPPSSPSASARASLALALLLTAAGCEGAPPLQEIGRSVVAAGSGSADRAPMRAVIPTRPSVATHTIVVEDERYVGDIARQLGVTVDEMLAQNRLSDPVLQRGQVLRVQTSADWIAGWEARRTERRVTKARREEEKRLAKAKAEADARAAKMLAKRLKRLRGKAAEAALVAAHAATQQTPASGPFDVTHRTPGGATVRTVRIAPPNPGTP